MNNVRTLRVAPVRERGLKFLVLLVVMVLVIVAPVRERGLKWHISLDNQKRRRRSREGAWIEIERQQETNQSTKCRSREGAWIEIPA